MNHPLLLMGLLLRAIVCETLIAGTVLDHAMAPLPGRDYCAIVNRSARSCSKLLEAARGCTEAVDTQWMSVILWLRAAFQVFGVSTPRTVNCSSQNPPGGGPTATVRPNPGGSYQSMLLAVGLQESASHR
jgi:hypothetical protein